VRIKTCNGGNLQHWADGKGGFFRSAAPDKCLDEGQSDGVKVGDNCDGRLTQRFALRGRVRSERANAGHPEGLCLHVQNATSGGDVIELASCNNDNGVSFTFWSTWK